MAVAQGGPGLATKATRERAAESARAPASMTFVANLCNVAQYAAAAGSEAVTSFGFGRRDLVTSRRGLPRPVAARDCGDKGSQPAWRKDHRSNVEHHRSSRCPRSKELSVTPRPTASTTWASAGDLLKRSNASHSSLSPPLRFAERPRPNGRSGRGPPTPGASRLPRQDGGEDEGERVDELAIGEGRGPSAAEGLRAGAT